MKNIIQTFYFGELKSFHVSCLNSFINYGYEVHFYNYDLKKRYTGLKKEVLYKDAGEIMDFNSKLAHYKKSKFSGNSIALFADIFRLELLKKKGGWWVDTDVFCNNRFKSSGHKFIVGKENKYQLNNAIIYSVPNGEVITLLLNKAKEKLANSSILNWGELGPILFTENLLNSDYLHNIQIMDTSEFYPINANLIPWSMHVRINMSVFNSGSFIHLYDSTLKIEMIDRYSPIKKILDLKDIKDSKFFSKTIYLMIYYMRLLIKRIIQRP